ncbi:hypothetical protein HKI87_16g83490 [Chloropicon roscoffensis]|uniref:Uncharacterized protein n=2 Tax=Chloropicon roscoffensis TaxID=1461544 RepID=A0AAX4PKA8_9CHLO
MPQPEEHRAIKRDFPSLASEYAEVEQAAREALGCLVGLQRALVEAAEGESAAPEEGWGALDGCHYNTSAGSSRSSTGGTGRRRWVPLRARGGDSSRR